MKVKRQVPRGPYVLDFLFPEVGLAVEVDGETHATPAARAADALREAWLAEQGIRVLRFTNREVLGELDGVLHVIAAILANEGAVATPPHPGPLPQAGEREK